GRRRRLGGGGRRLVEAHAGAGRLAGWAHRPHRTHRRQPAAPGPVRVHRRGTGRHPRRRGRRGGPGVSAGDRDAETDEPRPIVHEVPSAVSPYIRRIVADNPGAMTGPGTNTYLAGVDEIAVIDPGPDTDAHADTVAGCAGDRIRW